MKVDGQDIRELASAIKLLNITLKELITEMRHSTTRAGQLVFKGGTPPPVSCNPEGRVPLRIYDANIVDELIDACKPVAQYNGAIEKALRKIEEGE